MKINTIHLKRFTIGLLMLGLVALTGCGSTAGSSPSKAVATADEITALGTVSGKKAQSLSSITNVSSQSLSTQSSASTTFRTSTSGYSFTYKGTQYTNTSEITVNGKTYNVNYYSVDNESRSITLNNGSNYLQEYETSDFLANHEYSYNGEISQNEAKFNYNNLNSVIQLKNTTGTPVAEIRISGGSFKINIVIATNASSGNFKWPFKLIAKNKEFSGTLESDINASEATCDLYNQAGGLIGKLTVKQDGKISIKTYTDLSHSQLEEILATE